MLRQQRGFRRARAADTVTAAVVGACDGELAIGPLLDAVTAAHVAGGVCWAVGKANGLFRPQGERTMGRVKEALALHTTIGTYGKVVQRALVGYREIPRGWRPAELPDLLPLGHPTLLLGEVRRRLVRVRERALEAQQVTAA